MFEGGGCVRADRDTGAQTRDRGQVATATAGESCCVVVVVAVDDVGKALPDVRLVSTTLAQRCMH